MVRDDSDLAIWHKVLSLEEALMRLHSKRGKQLNYATGLATLTARYAMKAFAANHAWHLVLLASLAMTGGCQVVTEAPRTQSWSPSEWVHCKIPVYTPDGAKRELEARQAFLQFPNPSIVAFDDPTNQQFYLGPACNFYIQEGSRILGVKVDEAEAGIIFQNSFGDGKSTPAEGFEAAVARFEDKMYLFPPPRSTGVALFDVFGSQYIAGSAPDAHAVILLNYAIEAGTLRMQFTNRAATLDGKLWIDIASRKPTKAVLSNKVVLPRPPDWPVVRKFKL